MNPNPYETLNLKPEATQEEIKNAYRALAKKLHPDLNPGNHAGEKKFKEVNAAYELIGTKDARAKYDRSEVEAKAEARARAEHPYYHQTQYQAQGDNTGRTGRYSQSFQGADADLFSSIFGNQRQRPQTDEHYTMQVDFKDSILGGEKEFSLPNGRRLKVKIPPGIQTGKKLKFAGLASGSLEGDVYIEIKVNSSPLFVRNGNDLEIEMRISAIESLLGVEIKVPTLEGSVLLNIPPFVSSGQKIRMAGKGVPGMGDQFIILKIVNSKNLSLDPDLKVAVLEWSKRHPFNPREEKV